MTEVPFPAQRSMQLMVMRLTFSQLRQQIRTDPEGGISLEMVAESSLHWASVPSSFGPKWRLLEPLAAHESVQLALVPSPFAALAGADVFSSSGGPSWRRPDSK